MSDDKRAHRVWYRGAEGDTRGATVTDFSLTDHGHLIVSYHASEDSKQEGETGLINSDNWSAVEPCAVNPNAARFSRGGDDDLQADLPITTNEIAGND